MPPASASMTSNAASRFAMPRSLPGACHTLLLAMGIAISYAHRRVVLFMVAPFCHLLVELQGIRRSLALSGGAMCEVCPTMRRIDDIPRLPVPWSIRSQPD
jgi:hypothetical protein